MPTVELALTDGKPFVKIMVGPSHARLQALKAARMEIPAIQTVTALVDTGASITAIDPTVFKALGLTATGSIPMVTPSTGNTPVMVETFDVSCLILGPDGIRDGLAIPYLQVSASRLFEAQAFHVLIGRDILSRCLLTYDGVSSTFSLTF